MANTNLRNLKIIGALFVFVFMIIGAVVVRSSIDNGEVSNSISDLSISKKPKVVYCSEEIQDACDSYEADNSVEVIVEAPGQTLQRFVKNDLELEHSIWIVSQPWPEILKAQRQRQGGSDILGDITPLASSEISLTVWADQKQALNKFCENFSKGLSLECVSELAGKSWSEISTNRGSGKFKFGHGRADTDTDGLLAIVGLSASYLGTNKFASNDFDSDFTSWFTRVERSVPSFSPSAGSPIDQMLLIGSASYDVAIVIDAEQRQKIENSREQDNLKLIPTGNLATIVSVPIAGDASKSINKEIQKELTDSGWTETDILDNSFPSGGVLSALIEQWKKSI